MLFRSTVSITFSKADEAVFNAAAVAAPGYSPMIITAPTSLDPAMPTVVEQYSANSIAFELNIDGVNAPKMIDLSYLNDAAVTKNFTGVDIAREITNQINKSYGDERVFDFTQGDLAGLDLTKNLNTGTLMKLKLINPSIEADPGAELRIQFGQVAPTLDPAEGLAPAGSTTGLGSDGIFYFTDLSKVTREDALAAIQTIVAANGSSGAPGSDRYADLGVSYNAQLQTFTFKNNSATNLEIYASAPNLAAAHELKELQQRLAALEQKPQPASPAPAIAALTQRVDQLVGDRFYLAFQHLDAARGEGSGAKLAQVRVRRRVQEQHLPDHDGSQRLYLAQAELAHEIGRRRAVGGEILQHTQHIVVKIGRAHV